MIALLLRYERACVLLAATAAVAFLWRVALALLFHGVVLDLATAFVLIESFYGLAIILGGAD